MGEGEVMEWRRVQLRDVAEVASGFGFPRKFQGKQDEEYPFYKVGDMNTPGNESLMTVANNTVSADVLKTLRAKAFPAGTVVFPKIGAAIATNKKRKLTKPSVVDNNVMGLIPKQRIDEDYLFYWMRQFDLRTVANIGPVPSMRKSEVELVLIHLPPPSEQRRIVEILDQADALRKKRAEADKIADRILPALFYKIFGDPATNPKRLKDGDIESVADTTSGGTPIRGRQEFYGGSIPWVKSGELRQDVIQETKESLTEEGLSNSSAKMVPTGTVLVAMYGATVGEAAMLGIKACTNQAVCCIQPHKGKLDRYFLLAHLWLSKTALLSKREGGAQPNISQSKIRKFRLLLPPFSYQHTFGAILKDNISAKERRKTVQTNTLRLFETLLHRAFSGELTAKWREAHMKELLQEMELQAKEMEFKKNI